jgi:multisubunit Na+/H+ antiporter MnhG subunit
MAFRERIEWLTLLVMVFAYGYYFTRVVGYAGGPTLMETLWLFAKVSIVHAIVVIIGSIIIAVKWRKEAQAKSDERDRAISRRGSAIAYYVLMVGMILVGVIMPFTDQGAKLVNTALFALVIAEFVRHAIVLISYKRGWNG